MTVFITFTLFVIIFFFFKTKQHKIASQLTDVTTNHEKPPNTRKVWQNRWYLVDEAGDMRLTTSWLTTSTSLPPSSTSLQPPSYLQTNKQQSKQSIIENNQQKLRPVIAIDDQNHLLTTFQEKEDGFWRQTRTMTIVTMPWNCSSRLQLIPTSSIPSHDTHIFTIKLHMSQV